MHVVTKFHHKFGILSSLKISKICFWYINFTYFANKKTCYSWFLKCTYKHPGLKFSLYFVKSQKNVILKNWPRKINLILNYFTNYLLILSPHQSCRA